MTPNFRQMQIYVNYSLDICEFIHFLLGISPLHRGWSVLLQAVLGASCPKI